MTKVGRRASYLAGWVCAAILAALMILYVVFYSPLPFVESMWNPEVAARNDPLHKKARMADRLVSSKALIGKPRQEIAQMLGEPSPTGYFKDWDMVYNLGSERGFMAIDSEWLVIRLDNSGVAVEADVVRD